MRHIFVGLALFFALHSSALASEKTAFSSATKEFTGGFYPQAETDFSKFISSFPSSTRLPEAYFYQALCRHHQSNYVGALEILRARVDNSGEMADQYRFYIADTLAQQGQWREAAQDWASLNRNFPDSPLCMHAFHNEALAYSKLNEWQHVIDLLGNENGDFQAIVRKKGASEWAVSSFLLLAEAYLREHRYEDAEKVILTHPTTGDLARRRLLLLCRLQLASGRAQDALDTAANLPVLPPGKLQSSEKAENLMLMGEIYESLGQLTNAAAAYMSNLDPGTPSEFQRVALFKTVELTLKQNQTATALTLLSDFVEKRPGDPSIDVACLALGEIKMRAFFTPDTSTNSGLSSSNLLQQAITHFDRRNFTNSPLRGKAYLDRGWCYWTLGNIDQARMDFFAATELLTNLDDLAVAQFKLADAQLSQLDYGSALTYYKKVMDACEKSPTLKTALFNQVLYQALRAYIAQGDAVRAGAAIKNIVEWYPDTLGFPDKCLLLWGESQVNYAQAREIFSNLIKKFPNTSKPEVEFAIARSYALEGDWATAASYYSAWSTNYESHPLLPKVEFSCALAYDKAGYETVALGLFTNFVARFSSDELAPWAQNWVADYYFNQDDFFNADKSYKELVKMLQAQAYPNVGDLAYQSRLMIGRSIFAREELPEAGAQFAALISDLTKDSNAPPDLKAQTYFALGDTRLRQFREALATIKAGNTTNDFCSDAVNAFSKVTNSLAPLAQGRIGECNFAWAMQNPNNLQVFTNALHAFENVLQMENALQPPLFSASAYNEAQVNRGLVLVQLGRPEEALGCYLKVVYETDPARLDPVWLKEAAIKAAQLCKERGMWDKAVTIYQRVMEVIPSLRPVLEEEIDRAKSHKDEPAKQ